MTVIDAVTEAVKKDTDSFAIPVKGNFAEVWHELTETYTYHKSIRVMLVDDKRYRVALDINDKGAIASIRFDKITLPRQGIWWIKSEKSSRSKADLDAWWLSELDKRGIPIHVPGGKPVDLNNSLPHEIIEDDEEDK
jgi:hypothetical protein